MERIRVQNLRCLADTDFIEIKPVTVLVGANSSGKSTLLRVLPLLRQSAETKTLSGLLLNEGDVNFGFYPDAVHRGAEPAELKLEFDVTLRPGIHQGGRVNRYLLNPMRISCELGYLSRTKDSRYPYVHAVKLRLGAPPALDTIAISANEDSAITRFHVNDYHAKSEMSHLRLRVGRGLIPSLLRGIDDKDRSVPETLVSDDTDIGLFEKKLLDAAQSFFHGHTAIETRLETLRSIGLGTPAEMLESARSISAVGSWQQRVQKWDVNSTSFRNVRNLLLARATNDILSSANEYVSQLASSIQYFQPVRANVQRDYLSRDVQVSSVDPSGLNVAMVLASLDGESLSRFRKWMLNHFDFEVYPQAVGDGARIALRMKEKNSHAEFNLADMGFGFSQMLPFIVQMWKLFEHDHRRPRHYWDRREFVGELAVPRRYIIAIEQPELHLHPALQAKLADLFVTIATLSQERGMPIRFVLETHSSTIIERIGSHVEAKSISPDDVQILLFERTESPSGSNTSTVHHSSFDSEGVLQDWPFGFLLPPPLTERHVC
jgi:hypothetical protein